MASKLGVWRVRVARACMNGGTTGARSRIGFGRATVAWKLMTRGRMLSGRTWERLRGCLRRYYTVSSVSTLISSNLVVVQCYSIAVQ